MSVLSIDVGIKNLAVCLLKGPEEIVFWDVFDLGTASDTTRRLIKLNSVLNEHPMLTDTDVVSTVLIEKQPSFNPVMRVMASALHMYFVTKGFKDIKSYSAKYKLQLCETSDKYEASSRYIKNKKRSIDTTRYYLENVVSLNKWREVFSGAKKKDDYADSFLQGVSYYKIYKSSTREMKKPTLKTLASGKLDESHFAWLWNLWNQEHVHVIASEQSRPTTGPMDAFVNTQQETETYTIEKYIEEVSNENVMNQLVVKYGCVEQFVEFFVQ